MTPTRFDLERAALAPESDLPSISRYLVLVLCTRINSDANKILDHHQPSLTDLVRWSRLARSTVCVHLRILETRGWLVRKRPTRHAARTEHARTHYTLRIPELVRQLVLPSPADGPDLVREKSGASPPGGRKTSETSQTSRARARAEDEDHTRELNPGQVAEILRISETLRQLAPTRPEAHSPEWARRVAASIEGGTRNRLAYVEKVIRNNPSAYLPTPEPPRFRATRRDNT